MPCQMCGGRAKGRYCRKCERDRRHGNFQTAADLAEEEHDHGETRMECTACGTEYVTDGSDACPDCGAHRRRYAGDLDDQGEDLLVLRRTIRGPTAVAGGDDV